MKLWLLCFFVLIASASAWNFSPSFKKVVKTSICSLGLGVACFGTPHVPFPSLLEPVYAVSGGGKDFANKDLREGDVKFENSNNANKDFTQVLANDVSFKNAKLSGTRFYKANLNKADFTNADLTGASLEDAGLEGTILDNAVLSGAYLSSSFEDVGSIKNVDFSDALMPTKTTANLCKRPDATGTNPTTGSDTRDSLMCP